MLREPASGIRPHLRRSSARRRAGTTRARAPARRGTRARGRTSPRAPRPARRLRRRAAAPVGRPPASARAAPRSAAAGEIRVVPPGVAEIARLPREPLLLPTRPLGLCLDRLLERQRLAAERNLVVIVGQRPVDWVAAARSAWRPEPLPARAPARAGGRGSRGSPLRRAARPAAAESGPDTSGLRDGSAGRSSSPPPGRACDARVPAQVGVERRRAGLLRAEDQEARQRPCERGGAAVRSRRHCAQHRPRGTRDAGISSAGSLRALSRNPARARANPPRARRPRPARASDRDASGRSSGCGPDGAPR